MKKINNIYTIYFQYMFAFVCIISFLDIYKNRHYKMAWSRLNGDQKIKLICLLFVHNIIYFALYFTFFFIIYGILNRNKYRQGLKVIAFLYSVLLSVTVYHWYTNNDKCEFTVATNKILGIDEDTPFRDFFSIIFNTYPEKNVKIRGESYHAYVKLSLFMSLMYLFYI